MADTGFLGQGWNFPVGLDGGQIGLTPDAEEGIRQSIWTILATSPGERVMRPDFGCGIHDLVFGVNNAATATSVTRAVREALATWEPRIDVLDVYAVAGGRGQSNTAPDPSRPDVLVIEINYQVRSTNSRFNLVYPFYLE
jgi:phage baseplate assembly protein W